MMLKILLFAYSRKTFSGRKIELMLQENLPMMVLAEQRVISYHTINNFRSSKHANKLIKQCFVYFTCLLQEQGLIREDAIFIDGTKIEADANKHSFIWKKAVDKFYEKLKGQTSELYDELIAQNAVKAMTEDMVQTSEGLAILEEQTQATIDKLSNEIEQEPKIIPGGSNKKRKRRGLKKLLHTIDKDYLPRMRKYKKDKTKLGNWKYSEKDDYYIDWQGVRFNFGYYSKRTKELIEVVDKSEIIKFI